MGNRLSKIYTRTGDNGSTGMADGSRLSKADIIFTVMGDVDELNAHIGMIRALLPKITSEQNSKSSLELNFDSNVEKKETSKESTTDTYSTHTKYHTDTKHGKIDHYQHQLSIIQHLLFNIGGELAMPEYQGVDTNHINWLETDIDVMNQNLKPLKDFILPAGNQLTCQVHIARTVCRRAERHAVILNDSKPNALCASTYQFINRLSDWLFVFARLSTHPCFLQSSATNTQDDFNTNNTNEHTNEVLWDKSVLDNFA